MGRGVVVSVLVALALVPAARAADHHVDVPAARRYAQLVARRVAARRNPVVLLNGAYCGSCVREAIAAFHASYLARHPRALLVVTGAVDRGRTWGVAKELERHPGDLLDRRLPPAGVLPPDALGVIVDTHAAPGAGVRVVTDATALSEPP